MADEGYPGVAVSLGRDFRTSRFDADANRFCAGAGVLLSSVVQARDSTARCAGLEFAVGTPGTIGGALRINAGWRDEWLGARVASVTTYAPETGLVRRAGAEIAWGYRTSSFAPHDVLVECELAVEPADPFFIRGKMEASLARRKKTQPLTGPAAACSRTPKAPRPGRSSNRQASRARAMAAPRCRRCHPNFIVNTGGATAADVCALIELIRTKVLEAHGVELSPEVRFLGFA